MRSRMNSPLGLPTECSSCQLRPHSFFCSLSSESLLAFNQIKHPELFPTGATIYMEGEASRRIFTICQGKVKLFSTSRDGRTIVLRIAKAGDIIGLYAVVTGTAYESTAEAIQASQLNYVNREDFTKFLKEHGDACMRAVEHASREGQDAFGVIRTIALSQSVAERVAKFLLDSSSDGRLTNGRVRAKLTLTHGDIAQLMGTSRETITRVLSEFRKRELVEIKDSMLTIHNRSALQRIAKD